jgi:hypothetical protein
LELFGPTVGVGDGHGVVGGLAGQLTSTGHRFASPSFDLSFIQLISIGGELDLINPLG